MTDFYLSILSFLAASLSLLLFARSCWLVIFGIRRRSWWEPLFGWMALATGCLIAIDIIQSLRANSSVSYKSLTIAGVLAFVLFVSRFRSLRHERFQASHEFRRDYQTWIVLGCIAWMFTWSASSFRRHLHVGPDFGLVGGIPGKALLDREHFARTDRGRQVKLYEFSVNRQFEARSTTDGKPRFSAYGAMLISRAAADWHANCHGWVFTGGKYLLKGDDVERILEDNGYERVQRPLSGDLVVYRDPWGIIRHTGLVQAILPDGTTLVESKWGVDQRFLHLPADQPYANRYEYYRTSRGSHQIEVHSRARVDQGPVS